LVLRTVTAKMPKLVPPNMKGLHPRRCQATRFPFGLGLQGFDRSSRRASVLREQPVKPLGERGAARPDQSLPLLLAIVAAFQSPAELLGAVAWLKQHGILRGGFTAQ
jgi:hypothetical protein